MINIDKIADEADMIINGYAFTAKDDIVRVLNLRHPEMAAVINSNGEVIETTMCDIEAEIVRQIYIRDREYMES